MNERHPDSARHRTMSRFDLCVRDPRRKSQLLGGPRVYAYRSLLDVIALHLGKKPRLVPMSFGLWHALAAVAEMLPEPPITRNQVELLQLDNLTSPGVPGFGDLRISSTSLEDTLPSIVGLPVGLPRAPPAP